MGGAKRAAFFHEKQAAAQLKHGIYSRYLRPFVAMTGKFSPGKRVVILDTFAGAGEYEDGTSGSPKLAMELAEEVASSRNVECIFVEKDPAVHAQLQQNLGGYSTSWSAYQGEAEDVLGEILDQATRLPMFALIDPYGLGLSFEALTNRLLARAGRFPGQRGGDTTEVLLNFNLAALARPAGRALAEYDELSEVRRAAGIERRLNSVFGGDWWQEIWRSEPKEERRQLILRDYTTRLGEAAGGGWSVYTFGVGRGWKKPPIYALVFMTKYAPALWLFNDVVSCANEAFYKGYIEAEALLDLEGSRDEEYIAQVTRNLEKIIAEGHSFKVGSRARDIYEAVLGYARTTHVRTALKNLAEEGRIDRVPVGAVDKMVIRPLGVGGVQEEMQVARPNSAHPAGALRPSASDPPIA